MSRMDNLLGSFGIGEEKNLNNKQNSGKKGIAQEKPAISKPKTIVFRGATYHYARLRAKELKAEGIGHGNVSDFIEWLIMNDSEEHRKLIDKAQKLFELENLD